MASSRGHASTKGSNITDTISLHHGHSSADALFRQRRRGRHQSCATTAQKPRPFQSALIELALALQQRRNRVSQRFS
jgi:hypothetical protein